MMRGKRKKKERLQMWFECTSWKKKKKKIMLAPHLQYDYYLGGVGDNKVIISLFVARRKRHAHGVQ